ncbi:aldose 1-epimerase [Tricharina praecox]|uniref:aldose 1-epimerase n=1 Tax=Tricharina praecox TaxID=43433 RepID=UPI00221FDB8B|nr:aldose 1-epimerase [Tricharina praecox]KAI5853576.1 aldose 1-epimerase [Tricharina praecox]
MMRFSKTSIPILLATTASAAVLPWNSTIPPPDANGKYTLRSTGIVASFVPYGAAISNLFVADKHNSTRDVVLGWENATFYTEDPWHDHYGSVPGRYGNRIANASFTIDGVEYKVDANEHNGTNTLHGGSNGWDYRNWTVTALTDSSITFSLFDADGEMGFPGDVLATSTYTLTPYTWHITLTALSLTKKTPLLLTSHVYWNLDGFANPDSEKVYDHELHLPFSGMRIGVDDNLIPTGELLPNKNGSVTDFWSQPKAIGKHLNDTERGPDCGAGCSFYDNAFLVGPHDKENQYVARLNSPWSGVEVKVFTDQAAFQIYSCAASNGTKPIGKSTQGLSGRPAVIQEGGCVVMEAEDWIDGINNPEWGRKQIWGPEDGLLTFNARYEFSTVY